MSACVLEVHLLRIGQVCNEDIYGSFYGIQLEYVNT